MLKKKFIYTFKYILLVLKINKLKCNVFSAKVNKNIIYIILHFILVWLLNFWGMCSKITCSKIRMKGIYGVFRM